MIPAPLHSGYRGQVLIAGTITIGTGGAVASYDFDANAVASVENDALTPGRYTIKLGRRYAKIRGSVCFEHQSEAELTDIVPRFQSLAGDTVVIDNVDTNGPAVLYADTVLHVFLLCNGGL